MSEAQRPLRPAESGLNFLMRRIHQDVQIRIGPQSLVLTHEAGEGDNGSTPPIATPWSEALEWSSATNQTTRGGGQKRLEHNRETANILVLFCYIDQQSDVVVAEATALPKVGLNARIPDVAAEEAP